jgi:fumarate hydratase class II
MGSVVKLGRTHLQDATPITVGQELGGWVAQLQSEKVRVERALHDVRFLALGGTAVGTGLNTHPAFEEIAIANICALTNLPFEGAPNKFEALSAHGALVALHASYRGLAVALLKIANDIRLLASGPRSGLGELLLPENEPGSSIMPGKVNPTQCEAMVMVCTEIFGNDTAVGFAGATGQLQLNANKPLILFNVQRSARLLADAMESFRLYCVDGLRPNEPRIARNLENSLMLVTCLAPHIGYDRAAKIARRAYECGSTLKEATLEIGELTEEQFEEWVRPEKMVGNRK